MFDTEKAELLERGIVAICNECGHEIMDYVPRRTLDAYDQTGGEKYCPGCDGINLEELE